MTDKTASVRWEGQGKKGVGKMWLSAVNGAISSALFVGLELHAVISIRFPSGSTTTLS